jgi:DNA-binding CsgD family transcriptional regulator
LTNTVAGRSGVWHSSLGWAALTPPELRVVDVISAGHSNRSAAGELGASPNTVNTHLRAVFRRLDVKSLVQLTIAFQEHSTERD